MSEKAFSHIVCVVQRYNCAVNIENKREKNCVFPAVLHKGSPSLTMEKNNKKKRAWLSQMVRTKYAALYVCLYC